MFAKTILLAASFAANVDAAQTGYIGISSPARLQEMFEQKGIIKVSYANFGIVPYGHTMVSQ